MCLDKMAFLNLENTTADPTELAYKTISQLVP
jgi:hypothetical protein